MGSEERVFIDYAMCPHDQEHFLLLQYNIVCPWNDSFVII